MIESGALVEFQRETTSGDKVATQGWVKDRIDGKENNCVHTYLVIECYQGKGAISIHHVREDDVKLISKSKGSK